MFKLVNGKSFFSRKNKETFEEFRIDGDYSKETEDFEEDIELELELDDIDKKNNKRKKKKSSRSKNEKIFLLTLGSLIVLGIVSFLIVNVYVSSKVGIVDIYNQPNTNTQELFEENEISKEEKNTSNLIKKETKTQSYYTNMKSRINFKYNVTKNSADNLIRKVDEEKNKLEQEKKAKEKEKELAATKPNTSPNNVEGNKEIEKEKVIKNSEIQELLNLMSSLLSKTLKEDTPNYGGLSLLEVEESKLESLNAALQKKGTTFKEAKLHSLNPVVFQEDNLNGYPLNEFAVATSGKMIGDLIYIGNDYKGLKDEGTYWFGKDLYIE